MFVGSKARSTMKTLTAAPNAITYASGVDYL
jgi:hypothetical protein